MIAVAGGSYLYFHQSVASVRAHTPDVVRAARSLDIPVAHHAAIALVIGYDHRAGVESNRPSLSDTLMLIRADPDDEDDLAAVVPARSRRPDLLRLVCLRFRRPCRHDDRINSAYSRCGSKGTVLTIKHLTSLPINYLITVNFHGFKEVVDKLRGVWMDVDRRYYNKNTGSAYDNYANINLQPGYQRLDGQQALDFVRFRHTDSDLTRVARQQEFVRAFKDQVAHNFSFTELPSLVSTITNNIEVGEGGHALPGRPGHLLCALRAVAAARAPLPAEDRERAVQPRLHRLGQRHPDRGRPVRKPRRQRPEGGECGGARHAS